ncbi:hypothetical protein G7Y89_g9969 [Cudoniella acicularis]|uniref:Uncharacterized protein n=1 Tax=Cudoniella acicularis TaxID=354080 RepID=A0A8H4W226_9HELO|nr:hypothetical protein G7Y89_g9969 [Cudoniella acicularis]
MILAPREVFPRATCYRYQYGYSYAYNCNSAWYRWGRWLLAGILILIGIFLVLFILRRRRRNRNQYATTSTPMTTQPVSAYDAGYNNGEYNANGGGYYNQNQQYEPPTGAPPTHGENTGYYGQQAGVTQPANTYQQGK